MNPSPNDELKNSEELRLYYLRALGVVQFYPTKILPNAAPSVACEWFVEEHNYKNLPQDLDSNYSSGIENHTLIAKQGRSRREINSQTSLPAEQLKDDLKVEQLKEPVPSALVSDFTEKADAQEISTTLKTTKIASFQYLFIRLSDSLALLLRLANLSSTKLPIDQRNLLENLLNWLGHPLPLGLRARRFRWPLPGIEETDSIVAAQTLHGFLQQAWSEHSFSNLLMLGEMEENMQWVLKKLSSQQGSYDIYITYALSELVKVPVLKRETFKTLKPLHAKFV